MASKLKGKDPAETKPGKIKMLVFGKSGVGKSWLSMDFPSCYYIDSEGGARLAHYQAKLKASGGAYMGVEDGALDFDVVIDQIKALATEKHGFHTLAIGSITKLYQVAIAREQERLGDKDAFGASKKPAERAMRSLVSWIQRLDMNVLFEAHETAEWGTVDKQRQEIGQIPDCWPKLVYDLDLTLRLEKRGSSRIVTVRKSRLVGFPEGDTFPSEYGEFATRYGKDFIEAAVAPITLASKEQVAEIKRLLEIVKVDEKQVEKILTKAQADTWEEVSDKNAEATIKWLKGMVSA